MTRKTLNKKLTLQNPVIPPIKEGEELVEILASLRTDPENVRIERKAFFCEIIKWKLFYISNIEILIISLIIRNQALRLEIAPSVCQSVSWGWEYYGIVWGESSISCSSNRWPPTSIVGKVTRAIQYKSCLSDGIFNKRSVSGSVSLECHSGEVG